MITSQNWFHSKHYEEINIGIILIFYKENITKYIGCVLSLSLTHKNDRTMCEV